MRTPSGLVERTLRRAVRHGWRKGVAGGSPAWTALGAAAALGWLTLRALRRSEDVVFSSRLAPGETLQIFHEPRS
ncbi:MAG: hypothetical protein ACP5P1_05250 [Acidimicrobiales bacterium]